MSCSSLSVLGGSLNSRLTTEQLTFLILEAFEKLCQLRYNDCVCVSVLTYYVHSLLFNYINIADVGKEYSGNLA